MGLQKNKNMQNRNQTFSMKRFGKYALTRLKMDYKNLLSMAVKAFALLFLILFIMININQGNWYSLHWDPTIVISSFLAGVFYLQKAFPMLRKKEKMLGFYLTPASILEKYIYELLEKMGLFLLLFPVLFLATANLAIESILSVRSYLGLFSKIDSLSINYTSQLFSPGVIKQIMSAMFLLFSLVFVATTIFRKYAVIKIAALLVFYILLSVTYANFLAAENTWFFVYIQNMELNTRRLVFSATMLIVALIALLYGYFRIKEKEVQ